MTTQKRSLYNLLLLLFTTVIAGGCASVYEIGNDYDETAIFQSYQTYTWLQPEAARGGGVATSPYGPELDDQIRAAVESGLVKNGLRPEATAPSILLAYDITLARDTTVQATEPAPTYAYWYGYRYGYNTTDLANNRDIGTYSPGTIVVDIIDATTNELVWRGWAEAAIDPATVNANRINRVIASIMAQYPPIISTSY